MLVILMRPALAVACPPLTVAGPPLAEVCPPLAGRRPSRYR
jgi:hypothetical protein